MNIGIFILNVMIDHLALDGTTLANLEILHNMSSGSYKGSLLSKVDFTKSPHGSRLLRAWLLRPLFIKSEIKIDSLYFTDIMKVNKCYDKSICINSCIKVSNPTN